MFSLGETMYQRAKLEIKHFLSEDIITTSGVPSTPPQVDDDGDI